ncbi:hypothetical protein JEQ12_002391 [Ovis aries]|uniref:Uncharacterized protein n=1 Tax=Ovis aries TaxID=9940 RepID=A0A835ZXC7_SHEEP|nr:hypothetical protein JEQ12_002391 [Ovis aries]
MYSNSAPDSPATAASRIGTMPTAASPVSTEMQLRPDHGDAGKEPLDSTQGPHSILIESLLSRASLVVQCYESDQAHDPRVDHLQFRWTQGCTLQEETFSDLNEKHGPTVRSGEQRQKASSESPRCKDEVHPGGTPPFCGPEVAEHPRSGGRGGERGWCLFLPNVPESENIRPRKFSGPYAIMKERQFRQVLVTFPERSAVAQLGSDGGKTESLQRDSGWDLLNTAEQLPDWKVLGLSKGIKAVLSPPTLPKNGEETGIPGGLAVKSPPAAAGDTGPRRSLTPQSS